MSWQAHSDFSWVTLTSATSGTGLGDVTFQVAPNTSDQPRLAIISMPQIGRNAVIYQEGKPPEPPCAPVKIEFNQQISGTLSTSTCTSVFDSSLPALRYAFDAEAGRQVTIDLQGRVYGGIFNLIYPKGKVLLLENSLPIILSEAGTYTLEYAVLPTEFPQPGLFNFIVTQGCRYEFFPTRFELDAWGLPLTREKVYFPVKATASGSNCSRLFAFGDEPDVDNWLSGTHNQIVNELHISGYYNNIANMKQRYTVTRYQQQPFIVKQYAKCTSLSNLTFLPSQVNVPPAGGQQQIMVKQTGGTTCSWSLSPYQVYADGTLSSTSLIQMIPNDYFGNIGYGTGDRTIGYSVPANTDFTERKYALKMEDQVIQNITQAPIGGDCNRQSIQLGQTVNGTLSANDCAWAIAGEQVDFYQFNAVAGEQFAIELSANPSTQITAELGGNAGWYWSIYDYGQKGTARYPETGYVDFPASGTYTLRVHGKPGSYQLKVLGVGPAGCIYKLDKQGENLVPAASNSFTTNLTCNRADCDWTVQGLAPWITVPGGVSGKGSQTITFALTPNTGAKRQATITIAGRTFTIIQDAPCSYAKINTGYPDKIHTGPQGGEYRFYVETGTNCPTSITTETS
ncbi:MAG TPA: BACON domain-containing carbohydrate-binding protein [Blastocatellia bacterium]|nr:BACON domain-containing carbohydrate-binding protein [Blastocatellia bacterium]